ncbi:TrmB family transcriptional regulator [Thermospira aquatica]|uniref:Transcription regulator TrmB N-terminal domain-containing protein n=1 Tax=Thermospira aquatica TaxID=2828656 RepID=A0AAX3BC87_9SPIR|nr:helix-turn-helix domain-containing protein [Thermospira aquatica]URA09799.1 hypothetical protein KDW03_09975 [Thermospira aquatica]
MAIEQEELLIKHFERLGLSSNEAKVYLALLETHPITGYQLSKNSGILRPVVYEMLNRLVDKGGARIIKSNPDTYVPVEIEEFLRNLESDFIDSKKLIHTQLRNFMSVNETDFFWNIISQKNIENSILTLIQKATEEIFISVQDGQWLSPFFSLLNQRLRDGIKISIFSYYVFESQGLPLYTHYLDPSFRTPLIDRSMFLMAIDHSDALVAFFSDLKTAKATQSQNPVLIYTVRQKILSDIYLLRLKNMMGIEKFKLVLNDEDKRLFEVIEGASKR